jgi:hypothetical protein
VKSKLLFSGMMLILGFLIFLPLNTLHVRIAEIAAIQQTLLMDFSGISVVDKTVIAAWIRKDCLFPKSTYVKLNAVKGTKIYTITYCTNEWTGNTSYRIDPYK